ncbi:MAG TPA: protein kinase [Gemmatimonadales bacterium]|nr:protein kinase [Gemmatimonadales bacterium]
MSDPLTRLTAALSDRYRIERTLGQGGMATVYLAHDLKHDRRVALKVLRPELAAVIGAERFLAEIKTTANLQHPHILSLFDSGRTGGKGDERSDDFLYYVMPYIEGESLRDRLRRVKQLPIGDAVRIASEVAGALDYAHRHGVIHRDIKPENILLHDGRVLVADFGIALAVSRSDGATRMTETGMSLGTPHYMSPEQAMGEREITAASDIYALGCVTYEMLTGEPPFTGPTAQAIVAKLLTSEPEPITTLRKTVPPYVEAAVEMALQKLPADRFQSAKAFGDALGESTASATLPVRRAAAARVSATDKKLLYASLALSAVLLVAALIGWLRPRAAAETSRQRVLLWRYALPHVLDPGAIEETQAALAPDGTSIVFTDSTDGHLQLMRKARGASVATPIAGTEGAVSPFFSPDGHWIGFTTSDGQLKKVPIEGGGAVTLGHHGDPTYTAATWLDDGTIVYAEQAGLGQTTSDGQRLQLFRDTLHQTTAVTIAPLPGSSAVLYTACPDNCGIQSAIHLLDLKTHSDRELVPNAAGASYSPTGHLLYTDRAGGVYAVRFDLGRLRVTSGPVPVIDGVVPGTFSLTRSGTALYVTSAAPGTPAELEWVARDGSAVPFDSTWHGDFQYPAFSPDGKTLAVSVRDATTQLWVRRPGGARQQLSEGGTTNWRPAWTPDGKSIAFATNRNGTDAFDLYQVPADGSAPASMLLHHKYGIWESEFSPDGQWLVMRSDEEGNVGHIYGRRLVGDTALVPLVRDTTISLQVALSPDAHWIAYTSYATGRAEIYVAPFPGMRPTRIVSRAGGLEPRWAHSGRELFYREGPRFMDVPVSTQPTLTLGVPHELFSAAAYRSARNRPQYSVAPDDRHFLMIKDLGGSTAVMYVENWFPELLARVKR